MLSFNEFQTSDPVYGTNIKFLYPIDTTSALLITLVVLLNLSKSNFMELLMIGIVLNCSFKCLCSALSICSSLKVKVPPKRSVKIKSFS
ncbi:hypothetical protein PIROE2DRAFT_9223 [Piromyces sp. E2]|nr:hypothetical protein PIROE2DRAFT_9223 [Piromyces sp. E2]|eukprot:OUM64117.1 hypothetical protein PIROE2DRAFT_9223 [Piromyces sp. E2]